MENWEKINKRLVLCLNYKSLISKTHLKELVVEVDLYISSKKFHNIFLSGKHFQKSRVISRKIFEEEI